MQNDHGNCHHQITDAESLPNFHIFITYCVMTLLSCSSKNSSFGASSVNEVMLYNHQNDGKSICIEGTKIHIPTTVL